MNVENEEYEQIWDLIDGAFVLKNDFLSKMLEMLRIDTKKLQIFKYESWTTSVEYLKLQSINRMC